MIRIGILGNYGHNNLGDEAILQGLISLISKKDKIIIFTESILKSNKEKYPDNVTLRLFRRQFLKRIFNIPLIFMDIIKSIRSIDKMVIGGGGLLNDSYKYVTAYYCFVGLLCRVFGVRYDVLGISIGPICRKRSHLFSYIFLKLADRVVVRDQSSLNFIKDKNLTGEKYPDLALAIENDLFITNKDNQCIAFNVVPYFKPGVWYEQDEVKYLNYLSEMSNIISTIVNHGYRVTLFPIDTEFDNSAIKDLISHLKNINVDMRFVNVKSLNNTHELIKFLNSVGYMIGCRLHAAVLSTLTETPFISFGYQEKVINFCSEVNNGRAIYLHYYSNTEASGFVSDLINSKDAFIVAKQRKSKVDEQLAGLKTIFK